MHLSAKHHANLSFPTWLKEQVIHDHKGLIKILIFWAILLAYAYWS